MLRMVANDRAVLRIEPEPIRLLVLGVAETQDEIEGPGADAGTEGQEGAQPPAVSYARLSVSVADGPAVVHEVRRGDTLRVAGRTFRVSDVREDRLMGACVALDQTRE